MAGQFPPLPFSLSALPALFLTNFVDTKGKFIRNKNEVIMKDNKEIIFKLRLTKEEKEKLIKYAESRNITMSEAIRSFCYEIFNQKEN